MASLRCHAGLQTQFTDRQPDINTTKMTAKNETEISQKIQQKIAISMIGSGTIEKQFIHNYLDKNPSATTGEITEAYKHFVDDVTRALWYLP